jgi:hypothetical protein
MTNFPESEEFAVVRRMRKLYDECGPGAGQIERFLTKLHGAGWKERALLNGPPPQQILYGGRLRSLQRRIERIERHLKLQPSE